jgi:predicted O-methyltransferase YrrM
MNDEIISYPEKYSNILEATRKIGFDQLSDGKTGSLLSTLCSSKPNGKFLELGTGTGLCTSWILRGMCNNSTLISIDNDETLIQIAKNQLGGDQRVEFVVGAGEDLIRSLAPSSIDLIFADTWPGKYNHLEDALELLKIGGFYIIDDMLPQANWPEGHELKATNLMSDLVAMKKLTITKMCWSTGLLIGVKNA